MPPFPPAPTSTKYAERTMSFTRKSRKPTHVYSLNVLPDGSIQLFEKASPPIGASTPVPVVNGGASSPSTTNTLRPTTHLNMSPSALPSNIISNRPTYMIPPRGHGARRNIYIYKPTREEVELEKRREKRRIEEVQRELDAARPSKKRKTQEVQPTTTNSGTHGLGSSSSSSTPKDQTASPTGSPGPDGVANTPTKLSTPKRKPNPANSRKSKVSPAASPAPSERSSRSALPPNPSTARVPPSKRPRRKNLPTRTERPSTRGMARAKAASTQAEGDDAGCVAVDRMSVQTENGSIQVVVEAEASVTAQMVDAPEPEPERRPEFIKQEDKLPERTEIEIEVCDRETVCTSSGGSTPTDTTPLPFSELEMVPLDRPGSILSTNSVDVIMKDATALSIVDDATTGKADNPAADDSRQREMTEEAGTSPMKHDRRISSPELRRSGRVSKKRKMMS